MRSAAGRPTRFKVHKPYFNQTSEVHALLAPAPAPLSSSAPPTVAPPTVQTPPATSSGTVHPGRVPGRPVLEVPGWEDSPAGRSRVGYGAAWQPQQQSPSSRMRIFSGTSNQVGGADEWLVAAAGCWLAGWWVVVSIAAASVGGGIDTHQRNAPSPLSLPTNTQALAGEVAAYLGTDLGKINIKRFADGESYVQIGESVRGTDVFLVQPTSPPVNDHFMELAVMIDACKRASARSITAVIP